MDDKFTPNEPVEIYPAQNGFIVKRPHSPARGDYLASGPAQFMIFESFAGLSAWLAVHFTHRQPNVFKDMNEGSLGG